MKRLLFFVLAAVLLVPAAANASVIDSQKITVDLKSDGSAHISSTMTYGELTSIEFPYTVFGRVSGFSAKDSGGVLKCSATLQSYGGVYSCKPNSKESKNYSMSLEYDAENMIIPTSNAYTVSYMYVANTPLKNLEILLIMPEGTGLVNDDAVKPYPEATVGSTGRRTTLEWSLTSPELGKTYTFTATYEQLGQIINYYGNYSRYIAIFFALAFVFVAWRYWAYRKTNKGTVLSVLKDDEKKVFDIILQNKEKCKQNVIVQGTNFSKAKVSRILSDLEVRGLIEKIRVGRTNRVVVSSGKKRGPAVSEPEAATATSSPLPEQK